MSSFYGGGGSSFDPATLQTIKTYICGIGEYSVLTGLPTILNPDQNTFYLVPGENGYNEYYYKNGNWELFGSADIVLKNLKDASAIGSVKSVGATEEDINYTMGNYAFAQGRETKASGVNSHAQGNETISSGVASHSEGNTTIASGDMAHAEGYNTIASGDMSHVEGVNTIANHISQHVFGAFNIADPSDAPSTTRGNYIEIVGNGADVFGSGELRSNARTLDWSGNEVLAGKLTVGSGPTSNMDVATKQYVDQNFSSFDLSDRMTKGVDNQGNVVSGAIIEGNITGNNKNIASGQYSHAEGNTTKASGRFSHAEGNMTTASADNSHAEGYYTTASGTQSHSEGNGTTASGSGSHVEGYSTIANHKSQHVFGEYNIADPSNTTATNKGTYIEIVGNGTATNARSNARTLDWSGNEKLAGSLTLGMGTADETTITAAQLSALLALSSAEGVTF